jgi:2-polyprenyl-6-methoxyphenol hydroxylase-like FAD-dependent oxidoreductase
MSVIVNSYQGASQCIEDSASLALCLERAETLEDIPKVLAAYETIRKPRTECCIKKWRQNAQMLHIPDGEEQQKRDRYLLLSPSPSVTKPTNRLYQHRKADTEGLQLLWEKTGWNKECVGWEDD